jgi:hypothetical protein
MHAATRPARSRRLLVIAFAVLGFAGGAAAVTPQPYASSDFVFLVTGSRYIQDEAPSATSTNVLSYALRHLGSNEPVSSLRPRVKAIVATDRVIRITAQGTTPLDASRKAMAVALGYLHLLANVALPSCHSFDAAGVRGLPCARNTRDAYILGRPALLPHLPLLAAGTESGAIGLAAGLFVAALLVIFGAGGRSQRPRLL